MKLTEHQLKEIHQKSTRHQRNSDCPSSDELFGLLSNSVDEQSRAKMAAHLEECSDCSEEFKMARDLSENIAKSAPRKSYVRPMLVAATIVLALAAGILSRLKPTYIPQPVERGEQAFEFKTQPVDGEQLTAAPAKLKWSAIPGVQNYRVKLLDYQSALIADSGPISTNEYSLPDEIQRKLQPRQLYYWRIEYEKAGEQKSKLLHFSIR
jgi:hypothetical protein